MTDSKTNPLHNDAVAGLYRAIAMRWYFRYVEMRHSAEAYGGDVKGHGPLPSRREASEDYKSGAEEWLMEPVDDAAHALALTEFAACIAADQMWGRLMQESTAVFDSVDWHHQTVALAAVATWLNELAVADYVKKEGASLGGTYRPKPSA